MFVGCDIQPKDVGESSKTGDPPAAHTEPESDVQPDKQVLAPVPDEPRSKQNPVAEHLRLTPVSVVAGQTIELSVVLDVGPGFEIHDLNDRSSKFPTRLELELPLGFSADTPWEAPAASDSFKRGGGGVYRGEATFARQIKIADDVQPGDYLLTCSLSYQACNSRLCLRPVNSELSATISVLP